MTEKLNGFYSRKLRRAIAKAEGQPFEPNYNGKAPISFAEYLDGFKKPEIIPVRLRKSPLNSAESTSKAEAVSE